MAMSNIKNAASRGWPATMLAPEIRAWRGEAPLWKVFWLYGVVAYGIASVLYALAIYADHVALQQVLLVCAAGYSAWAMTCIWRCADNTAERLWSLLARL